MKDFIALLISNGFYSCKLPPAPGTAGSVVAALVWLALAYYLPVPAITISITLSIVTVILGVIAVNHHLRSTTDKDPSYVVIDEWAGIFISFIPITTPNGLEILLAFALFRLFDILKPGPVGMAENLKDGWGVMGDDIVAGGLAAIFTFGFQRLLN